MGALNGRRKFLNILSNIWLILGIINKTISENNTILIWKNSMVKCFGNEERRKWLLICTLIAKNGLPKIWIIGLLEKGIILKILIIFKKNKVTL